jgi:hypothetical protein
VRISGLDTYGMDENFNTDPTIIKFRMKPCLIGDAYTNDSKCLRCSNNEYLLAAPTVHQYCIPCNANINCYGGSIIAPKDGYWRADAYNESILKCPNSEACQAGNYTNP